MSNPNIIHPDGDLRDDGDASKPEMLGCYITKAKIPGDQKSSWSRVVLEIMPVPGIESDEISKDTRHGSLVQVDEEFQNLSAQQQGIIRRIVAEEEADRKTGSEQWNISYLRAYRDKTPSTNAAETDKILLVLKRDSRAVPLSTPAGRIVDLNDPLPDRVKAHENKFDEILKLVNRDLDAPANPAAQVVPTQWRRFPTPAKSPEGPAQGSSNQDRMTPSSNSRTKVYGDEFFTLYRTNSTTSNSKHDVAGDGRNEAAGEKEEEEDEGGEEAIAIEPEVKSDAGSHSSMKVEPPSADETQATIKGNRKVNFSEHVDKDEANRHSSAQPRPKSVKTDSHRSSQQSNSSYGSFYPPRRQFPATSLAGFPSTAYDKVMDNPFRRPNPFSVTASPYDPRFALPRYANQATPPPVYYPSPHTPHAFANQYSPAAPVSWNSYPTSPYHQLYNPGFNSPSLPAEELENAKFEIEALKKELLQRQQQIQEEIKSAGTQWRKEMDAMRRKLEAAEMQRDAVKTDAIQKDMARRDEILRDEANREVFVAELNSLRALIQQQDNGREAREKAWQRELELRDAVWRAERDLREAAWRKEREDDLSSMSAVLKSAEKEKLAKEEAEKNAALAIVANDEQRRKEILNKTVENEGLREQLREQLEINTRREHIELTKEAIEAEVAVIKRHAGWQRRKDISIRDREIEGLRAKLRAVEHVATAERFKAAVNLGVQNSMANLIHNNAWRSAIGSTYLKSNMQERDKVDEEDDEVEEEEDEEDEEDEEEEQEQEDDDEVSDESVDKKAMKDLFGEVADRAIIRQLGMYEGDKEKDGVTDNHSREAIRNAVSKVAKAPGTGDDRATQNGAVQIQNGKAETDGSVLVRGYLEPKGKNACNQDVFTSTALNQSAQQKNMPSGDDGSEESFVSFEDDLSDDTGEFSSGRSHATEPESRTLIEKFVHRCYECLDLESTSDWLVESNVVRAGDIIHDFAILMKRKSKGRSTWCDLFDIILAQRDRIVARIRDSVHTSRKLIDQKVAE